MFTDFRSKLRSTIMDFYKRALALREETISHRRWLHSNAEVGLPASSGHGCASHAGGKRRKLFLPNRHGGSYMRPRFPRGHAADSGKDIKRK